MLASRDAEAVLRFAADLDAAGSDGAFTEETLVELGRLISADRVSYTEQDRVRRRLLVYRKRPGDGDDAADTAPACFLGYDSEHPIAPHRSSGVVDARRISDFTTPREFHRTGLYESWYRAVGVEHEMTVVIPSPPWHLKGFIFNRANRDFGDRDRLVLNAVQPHLVRAWSEMAARQRLASALAVIERRSDPATGVLLIDADGGIAFASEVAEALVDEFFTPGAVAHRVPPELAAWFGSGSPRLTRRGPGRVLMIERVGDTVLLRATEAEAQLTRREVEVLSWVARGRTNQEVARLVRAAPGTVRKHLEHINAKLGVSTRSAAVARYFGGPADGADADRDPG
jgi:DNA-binding CsgD family transcriptional regulator